MSANPFTPGYGSQPPLLAGRDELLDRAVTAYRSGPGNPDYHLVLHGPRGVGKTVLADAIAAQAERELGWTTVSISGLSSVDAPSEIVRQAGELTAARHGRQPRRLDAQPTVGINLGVIKGEVAPRARSVATPSLEPALTAAGQHAAARRRGVLVLIDEVQAVPAHPDLRDVVTALQATRRRNLPIAAVLTGLPSTPQHLAEAGTFTERMRKVPLGHLDRNATRLALLLPITEHGATITSAALEAATDATRGYPYFVQLYGYQCWELARGGAIGLEHVAAAVPAVAEEAAENIYQPRMARLSPLEAAYTRAVAEHGERYVPTAAAARVLHRTLSQLSRTREALISDHCILISERTGTVSFAVPGFAAWLRATTPLVVPPLRTPPTQTAPTTHKQQLGETPPDQGRPRETPRPPDPVGQAPDSESSTYQPHWPKPSRERSQDLGL